MFVSLKLGDISGSGPLILLLLTEEITCQSTGDNRNNPPHSPRSDDLSQASLGRGGVVLDGRHHLNLSFASVLIRFVKVRVRVVSVHNIVYRTVNVPLLRDVVQSQHRELTDLKDFFWFPSIEDILRVRGQIYVSMVYDVML